MPSRRFGYAPPFLESIDCFNPPETRRIVPGEEHPWPRKPVCRPWNHEQTQQLVVSAVALRCRPLSHPSSLPRPAPVSLTSMQSPRSHPVRTRAAATTPRPSRALSATCPIWSPRHRGVRTAATTCACHSSETRGPTATRPPRHPGAYTNRRSLPLTQRGLWLVSLTDPQRACRLCQPSQPAGPAAHALDQPALQPARLAGPAVVLRIRPGAQAYTVSPTSR